MRLAILVWEEEKELSVLKGFTMDQEKALDTMIEREKMKKEYYCFH
jgi:hypothetical protein